MLNIRINLTINLKKVTYAGMAMLIALSHVVTPAYAVQAAMVPTVKEKTVTVSLAHLKVQTTRSQALASVTSTQAKYFDAEALTFLTVYSNGWDISEWKCLQYVWKKESNFNPKALNKGSGAFGIAQFLPSTWGNYKVTQTQSTQLQVKYGLRYIEKRYGSACGAKAFWIKHGWY